MENKSIAITHVIFDCDGTLINTTEFFSSMISFIGENLGKQVPKGFVETLFKNKIGMREAIDKFSAVFDVEDKDLISKLIKESLEQSQSKFKLMPGVEKLVRHLSRHNIPMAITTGGTRQLFDTRIKCLGDLLKPGNLISHVVCTDDDPDVKNPKPFPDVYLVCAKRFAYSPLSYRNVLVIEDTYDSIKAADSIGMTTLLVPSELQSHLDDETFDCDYVLRSLVDFKPEVFSLPPY